MTYRVYKASKSPLIEQSDGHTHFDLTQFLIFRINFHANKYTTTYYEAGRLVNWLNFLTQNNMSLYAADTSMIVQFRDEMLAEDKDAVYVNQHILTICGFYWWAQNEGIVSYMIGWLDIDHPERQYLIRVHKANGNSSLEYSIPYLKKVPSRHQQPIPKCEDIEFLEELIYQSHHLDVQHPLSELACARDLLIFRWLTEVSLRRNELVSLDITDIQNVKTSGNTFTEMLIHKGTKYSKKRRVLIREDLLQATRDYIEYERAEILNAKRNVFGKPDSVKALFVNIGNSAKNARMNGATIYKFLKNVVKNNKDIEANPHALRRYSLTELACDLFRVMMNDKDAKSGDAFRVAQANTLNMLANHAGHNSSDTTIRSYVDIAQTRYMLAR